jgi:hypothetical protein
MSAGLLENAAQSRRCPDVLQNGDQSNDKEWWKSGHVDRARLSARSKDIWL